MSAVSKITRSQSCTAGHVLMQVDGDLDLLQLHRADPQRYPYLLESVARGSAGARYDILFAFPGPALELSALSTLRSDGVAIAGNDFLDNLDDWWRGERSGAASGILPPFRGGWFLYLGYELVGQIEPCLNLPDGEAWLPLALARRVPAAIIRDHASRSMTLVAETEQAHLLEQMRDDLRAQRGREAPHGGTRHLALDEQDPQRFLQAVGRIKRYIVDGDVFQVNLSRGWQGRLPAGVAHADLYDRLRVHNPAPFAGLFTHGEVAVISSSPERLVCTRGDVVQTRPIAGTRPRGTGAAADRAFSRELLAHPKERAEHVMLIDLERNDLGRVCVPGSIEVNELMVLESYTHVHHIVSNVRGRLRAGVSPGAVIRAVFPGGTITGCPKVRCMEIIAELEQSPRGPYTGSMGYLNRDGSMDLNILIRTMVRRGDALSLRAGAGIVADSVPERELEETRAKALGMVRALGGNA